jgi:hypothetical protein
MRSVYIHYPSSYEPLARVWLDENAERFDTNLWHIPNSASLSRAASTPLSGTLK